MSGVAVAQGFTAHDRPHYTSGILRKQSDFGVFKTCDVGTEDVVLPSAHHDWLCGNSALFIPT